MSCSILNPAHIDAMLGAVIRPGNLRDCAHYYHSNYLYWYNPSTKQMERLDESTVNEVGQMLVDNNYRSVNHRYDEDDVAPTYKFTAPTQEFSPGDLLKIISCYEYQSCESEDWFTSSARDLCASLRSFVCHMIPTYHDSEVWSV